MKDTNAFTWDEDVADDNASEFMPSTNQVPLSSHLALLELPRPVKRKRDHVVKGLVLVTAVLLGLSCFIVVHELVGFISH